MNVDEIPRRGAKIDEKASHKHPRSCLWTGLPRAVVKPNVHPKTYRRVHNVPTVCGRLEARLDTPGHRSETKERAKSRQEDPPKHRRTFL